MSSAVDEFADRARAREGQLLRGKWTIDALLGIGGMAAVYRATHRNGARVAIKMLHPELAVDAEIRGRFLREGYIANTIGHPAVVAVLDDDVTDDGAVFLVMELLEGEPLDALLERRGGTVPIDELLRIADQTLDVLAAAHAKGVIHRDLKPQNLFLTHAGEVKLLDFGIARVRQAAAGSTGQHSTRTGISMGTPGFMSPEQAQADWDAVDARADLWAVGATLFTLVTGKYLHEAKTVNLQLLLAMTKPAPLVRSVRADLPASVAEVIDRALAFERSDRWADARAMQAATRSAQKELGALPVAPPPPAIDLPPKAPRIHNPSHPSQVRGEVMEPPTLDAQKASRSRVLLFSAGAALLVGAGLTGLVLLVYPTANTAVVAVTLPAPIALAGDGGTRAASVAPHPVSQAPASLKTTLETVVPAARKSPAPVAAPAHPIIASPHPAVAHPKRGAVRPRIHDDALFDQRN